MKVEDIVILIGLCAALVLGVVLGARMDTRRIKKEAISLGHAQYNPTNANFEWRVCK